MNNLRVCWDKIGFGDYRILQDREQFSYGIDAVLLADFASRYINEKKNSTEGIAVDLGTGTGVIPLILAHKTRLEKIIGLDIEKYFVKLAKQSAVKNGLDKRVFYEVCDVREYDCLDFSNVLGVHNINSSGNSNTNIHIDGNRNGNENENTNIHIDSNCNGNDNTNIHIGSNCNGNENINSNIDSNRSDNTNSNSEIRDCRRLECDFVLCNPPYFRSNASIPSRNSIKDVARREIKGSLRDFCFFASNILKRGGEFYLIHKPERLIDVFASLRDACLEPRDIRMVSSTVSGEPKFVLVRSIKNGGENLRFMKPLTIYENDGHYTKEILKIYERVY